MGSAKSFFTSMPVSGHFINEGTLDGFLDDLKKRGFGVTSKNLVRFVLRR